jgi:hypothetical protein
MKAFTVHDTNVYKYVLISYIMFPDSLHLMRSLETSSNVDYVGTFVFLCWYHSSDDFFSELPRGRPSTYMIFFKVSTFLLTLANDKNVQEGTRIV